MEIVAFTPEEIEIIQSLLLQKIRYFNELYENENGDDFSFRRQLCEKIAIYKVILQKLKTL